MISANPIQRPSVLEVRLNQMRVGTLTNLPYDRNLFVFDEAYIQNADRPVLSLSSYNAEGGLIVTPQEVQTKAPPFLSNLLPEGKLREYVSERGGVKQVREFFLLWLLGTDLPGAVVMEDAERRPLPPREPGKEEALERREELLRFSLAGVQLKFSAVGDPARQLTIPTEGRGGYWIVKLPSPRFSLLPENEFSMMTLAREVGIDVADVGLTLTGDIKGLPSELRSEKANSSLSVASIGHLKARASTSKTSTRSMHSSPTISTGTTATPTWPAISGEFSAKLTWLSSFAGSSSVLRLVTPTCT